MSADKGHDSALEESFTTKLGIRMVGTKQFGDMIDQFANVPRVVVCGIGKAGIGKSHIARQRAKARKAPMMVLHIPQMSIEDYYVPAMAADTKQYYDKRIPRTFQNVLDFCADPKNKNVNPIMVIEEPNRANDKNVTKALFTIIEDRMIGDTRIPDQVQIVCLMNPSEGGMLVNEFEKDPAYRRRLLFVGVRLAPGEFLQYAEDNFFKGVVDFLRAQTKYIYDDKACAVGKVYPNPAAWETVSDILKCLETQKVSISGKMAADAISGKIGTHATEALMAYLKDADSVISPTEILKDYKDNSKVRQRVKKLCDEGRGAVLIELCGEIATTLFDGKDRKPETFNKQLSCFMDDLPPEVLVDFIKMKIQTAANAYDGGYDYFRTLNQAWSKDPAYQSAWKRYTDIVLKAEKEKTKGK